MVEHALRIKASVNLICTFVSSTGAKLNGNLEGPGSAEFKDGHMYEVYTCNVMVIAR